MSIPLDFSVSDTSISLADDILSEIFNSFAQGDDAATWAHGGMGIWLVLGKHIVAMMAGRIQAGRKIGKGSMFSFTVTSQQGQVITGERHPCDDQNP